MLVSLAIRDILIIDRLDLAFRPGLNVLTGETGAGKSILLDALGSVLGWRGRGDLVRHGAETGSVEVTERFVIERYSHVMHISSNVEGRLAKDRTAMDVLRATLPVGTLSGAPKIRAMEIIDELEPVKRGIYGGAVGYLAWNGNMDTAIAIRTAVVKDGTLYVEAGGGVVADSQSRLEWMESLNKGRAIFAAAALAEGKLKLEP